MEKERKKGRKEGRKGEIERKEEKRMDNVARTKRTRHYVGDEGGREGASDPWAVINNSKE